MILQKDVFEMIFTIKEEGNDFYYKNAMELIFTLKMHWK